MTTRNLTESFIFMRNNSLQNRHYNEDTSSDKTHLLHGKDGDVENSTNEELPHEYSSLVRNLQLDFSRIAQKMKELISLHARHLNRASLDDNVEEDAEIEHRTKELTTMFMETHRRLSKLSSAGRSLRMGGGARESMATNIQADVARQLMDLSVTFRRAQSQYLAKLKSRDDRLRGFLEHNFGPGDAVDDSDGLPDFSNRNRSQPQQQLRQLHRDQDGDQEAAAALQEREREISEVVRSIVELNSIFRDVSQLVADQGGVVDRIDRNVQQTQLRVREGLGQLQRAHKLQRGNRKMVIIVVLGVLAACLALTLLLTKI